MKSPQGKLAYHCPFDPLFMQRATLRALTENHPHRLHLGLGVGQAIAVGKVEAARANRMRASSISANWYTWRLNSITASSGTQ